LLAVGALAQAASALVGARANARLAERLAADLRERLVGHLLRLPIAYVERQRASALTTRVQHGLEGLLPFLVRTGVDAVAILSVLVVVLPLLVALEPVLTGTAAALSALVMLVARWRLRRSRDDFRRSSDTYAALTAALSEIIDGFRAIRGARQEELEFARYAQRSEARLTTSVEIADREAANRFGSESLRGMLAAALLFAGALQVAQGATSVANLVAFGALLGMLATPLSAILGQAPHVLRAASALADAREFLENPAEATSTEPATSDRQPAGALRFEHVSFAHPDGPDVLCDVTLDIKPGSLVGIVGSSGAGKSTLLDVAARIYAPTSGQVLLDGADVRSMPISRYRSLVAAVGQDVFLFDRSVRENVAYGRPDASEPAVHAACEAANALAAIASFPDGMASQVGERGHRVSGGERQRLALARALLCDPVVLLLDEVTSHIDPVSEAEIARALHAQRGRRTTIVVAHRVAFVREADLVCVIEGGRIVDQGSPAELLSRAGRFRDMVFAGACADRTAS
jgi:ABC-type multidrug transport system fused ATPase/permease subunit